MKRFSLALLVAVFFGGNLFGYETDQFTLPPKNLRDIGPDLSAYVQQKISQGLKKFNSEFDMPFESLDQINERELAQYIFESIDGGVKLTEKVEGWLGNGSFAPPLLKNKYPNDYLSFRQTPDESIYRHATYHRGFGVAYKYLFSATINMFGIHLGTDKLGHFFKQGHQYFDLYIEALNEGQTQAEAQKYAAYERGVKTENGIFGIGLSGVFSNADLFTNYTGMKFYQNLIHPVTISKISYPAILKLQNGKLVLNNGTENLPDELMKRFIYLQMNEAMNPSFYDPIMFRAVKKNMKNICPVWKKNYPDYNIQSEALRLDFFKMWWGEDYGHSLISNPQKELVTIGNSCFSE